MKDVKPTDLKIAQAGGDATIYKIRIENNTFSIEHIKNWVLQKKVGEQETIFSHFPISFILNGQLGNSLIWLPKNKTCSHY